MVRSSSVILLTVASLAGAVLRAGAGAQEQDAPNARNQRQDRGQQERPQAEGQMQCPMMAGLKGVELFADSPAVLLAQAKELKLTEQQVQQLERLEESTRTQVRKLLTEEQRQQLEDAPKDRLSMMELCMHRMQNMPSGQDGQAGPMCPMCKQMMDKMKRGRRGAGGAAQQEERRE